MTQPVKKTLNIALDVDLYEAIVKNALDDDLKISQWLRRAIKDRLTMLGVEVVRTTKPVAKPEKPASQDSRASVMQAWSDDD